MSEKVRISFSFALGKIFDIHCWIFFLDDDNRPEGQDQRNDNQNQEPQADSGESQQNNQEQGVRCKGRRRELDESKYASENCNNAFMPKSFISVGK